MRLQRWIIKSAIQRVISWLPQSHWWNGLLQKHITKGFDLTPTRFEAQLDFCRIHLEHYLTVAAMPHEGFVALEIGPGWFPIVPVGLYLCGASEIRTYDIAPLIFRHTFKQTLRRFCEYAQNGGLQKILPRVRMERMAQLDRVLARSNRESPVRLLKELNIQTVIGDARRTGLAGGCIDLVFSTEVLEHIPREVLAGLFAECLRISSKDGTMSHYIGMADQFAGYDRSITPFNFLKYPASCWRLLNNPIIPQNRLRLSDYRSLIEQAGYRIVKEIETPGRLDDLRRIPLAPEFRKYSLEDLLVLYSWLVATPA